MTIRKARHADLRAMAEVSAAAFMDEELHGRVMHPHRKEYPIDFILFFERQYLHHWFNRSYHFLVGLDKLSGKVIAVAEWHRQGSPRIGSESWRYYLDSVRDKTLDRLVSAYNRASSHMWPNRAADPTKTSILEETFPMFSHFWSGSREQNWCLEKLATHPDFQRQGVGRELVNWGVEEADKENIWASVISSYGNESFYEKSGFVEVGRSNVGPLKEYGIRGGAVMFREAGFK